ncbi:MULTISPECIES: DNA internalization-related competence protein ComEC/Rec2 [unclassified Undibacterium]|uniref:DNA internalization-related competence protein ComEC/Rec2 n=1 Tax=unclassified Undibacterium TaxID=2630295 RepID=UPI002AC9165C|nr:MULTISPECIES: DNA internalization-related competence protein ComEC/Rec2 [unclassified Undibacterium]MEB0140685.1 DNA internalization-related competence protein ComEC/Rec2 [Undibacterium sp. CCC2.1]MEB0173699.1 DNA internalization-related competence protein ComEC/Rec2 [Undibacterium sp. CCC1.1]MEB0177669.1 DNA internalization-related competence protein ComEC/Rec2 [Undibacterium sp. CCC3.4]MEB0216866.1 DNA internalization-related competence protein ComEC/Rec2 [Undibacterium sp. 5I2]WPX43365.1
MRSACLAFVFGVACLQQQHSLYTVAELALLALCATFLLLHYGCTPHPLACPSWWRRSGVCLGFALAGLAWAAAMATLALQTELTAEFERSEVTLIGCVASLPQTFEAGQRLDFAVEQVLAPRLSAQQWRVFPKKISLSWSQLQPALLPGERWQLRVRVQRPHGYANLGGFDTELRLLESGVRAVGTVRSAAELNRRLDPMVWQPRYLLERSRGWLRARIFAALPNHPYAGVLVALVIGEQRAISAADWVLFNRTGIGHLISISGLHVSMIAALFAKLSAALWRRARWRGHALPLLLPAQKVAAVSGASAALLYVALAGFGIPAQRTLIMLLTVALALWCGRISDFFAVLCLALVLVLLCDPWAVLAPGFWLSFLAVAVLTYAAAQPTRRPPPGWQRWRALLLAALRSQWAVSIGLLPLSLFLFGQVALLGALANALAIPLISLAVTPLALLGSVMPSPISGWLLQISDILFSALMPVLQYLSGLPAALWRAERGPWWAWVLAACGVAWALLPRGWPLRWLGLVCCLPMLFPARQAWPEGSLRMTVFDIGQGTAVLLETAKHRLLYDAGPRYSVSSDAAQSVLLPYLQRRAISALDVLMISHADLDHAGGAASILQSLEVAAVASSLASDHPLLGAARQHWRCHAGQRWQWDGVVFEVLQPALSAYANEKLSDNARSCTLKVSSVQHAVLLPGDIAAAQETALLAQYGEQLRASVLLVPHHGSKTSSSAAFLAAVQPQAAIFQFGHYNRYRHPHSVVWQRYADVGSMRWRTDRHGALSVELGERVTITAYRQQHARYWHGR